MHEVWQRYGFSCQHRRVHRQASVGSRQSLPERRKRKLMMIIRYGLNINLLMLSDEQRVHHASIVSIDSQCIMFIGSIWRVRGGQGDVHSGGFPRIEDDTCREEALETGYLGNRY